MISDRMAEITAVHNTFTTERNNLVKRQLIVGAVAVLVAIALALLGVRFLSRRYIAGPINRLLNTARHVMEGGHKDPIVVTPESDYAPLEALLQSGQILRRMEESQAV